MEKLLEIKNLKKTYDHKEVLKDISIVLNQGEIIGLIGKNGAGKTTLMKILLGLTSFDYGSIEYKGDRSYLQKYEVMSQFGYLLECKLFEYLNGFDNLYVSEKYANSPKNKNELKGKILELLNFVDLPNNHKMVKGYSFGMKQRLGLVLALMGNPKVLILDEPFVGLDPMGVEHFKRYIFEMKEKRGITILISSHQLSEIEQICDRYLFIRDKKVKEIVKINNEKIKIILHNPTSKLIKKLKSIVYVNQNEISFSKNMQLLDTVLKLIYLEKGEIQDIDIENTGLENLFKE